MISILEEYVDEINLIDIITKYVREMEYMDFIIENNYDKNYISSTKNLSVDFMKTYPEYIDIDVYIRMARYIPIENITYILDTVKGFDINEYSYFISKQKDLIHNQTFMDKYENVINWSVALNMKIDIDIVKKYKRKMWYVDYINNICTYHKLTMDEIKNNFAFLHKEKLLKYQKVDCDFLHRNVRVLSMNLICKYQFLSDMFILKNIDYINWEMLHKNEMMKGFKANIFINKYMSSPEYRYINWGLILEK